MLLLYIRASTLNLNVVRSLAKDATFRLTNLHPCGICMQLLYRAFVPLLVWHCCKSSQWLLCHVSYEPWPQSLSMAVRMSAPPLPEEAPFLPCEPLPSRASTVVVTAAPTFPEGRPFLP